MPLFLFLVSTSQGLAFSSFFSFFLQDRSAIFFLIGISGEFEHSGCGALSLLILGKAFAAAFLWLLLRFVILLSFPEAFGVFLL